MERNARTSAEPIRRRFAWDSRTSVEPMRRRFAFFLTRRESLSKRFSKRLFRSGTRLAEKRRSVSNAQASCGPHESKKLELNEANNGAPNVINENARCAPITSAAARSINSTALRAEGFDTLRVDAANLKIRMRYYRSLIGICWTNKYNLVRS